MGNANIKANPVNTTAQRCFASDDEIMNQFTLVWLDESSLDNSVDSLRTKTLLRETVREQCLFFDRSDLFLQEIEKV